MASCFGIKTIALLMAGGSIVAATAAFAQAAPQGGQQPTASGQAPEATGAQGQTTEQAPAPDIVVVGSQIRGSKITDVLPVTVVDQDDIDATAATSGDDLFRSIPQAGDVAFNESHDVGGINDARGDVASINLRALGTGNTLVLLNGRRMVLHPGTQTENLVPVQSVNMNTIPVMGVDRVEVLRDGAAAIYGTDAVAGVVNTVLKDHFDGLTAELEVGHTDNSGQDRFEGSFEAGKTFNHGRTNISLFGEFAARDPLYARERRNSRSSDLRPLVAGTKFEGDSDFDNRSTDTIWGEFQRLTGSYKKSTTSAKVDGITLTTNGIFHVQPDTNDGCIAPAGDGICYDNSTLSTLSTDNDLKYDTNTERTVQGKNKRINLFSYINHEFSNSLSFFGEVGFYHSNYHSLREQETSLASQRLIIPADGYWNPFGPVGSPSRIPGLTGVQDSGVPIELQDYRPVDAGPTRIHVRNTTWRFLGGLRGTLGGWNWESAGLYSQARTNDTMRTISASLFEEALSRTDATAYNPFNGGDPLDPSRYDSTPNPQSVIDSFLVDVSRISKTSLASWDAKFSRPDFIHLPGGDVGIAAGVEYRHESFSDDRDPRLDGTIAYIAPDGSSNGSDALGASPTPDTHGSRDVESAYVELAVPLISPSMGVPLVHSIDMQLAGRFEDYTSFGSVAKPKIALSWHPIKWAQVRSSWSLGFRAPNLPQLFEQGVQRSNTRTDWIRCEADLRKGVITNFDDCAEGQSVVSNRSGSQSLKPEKAKNFSLGVTVEPPIPHRYGDLILTADFWSIKQKDVIGLFGDANALTFDYLLRLQGSSNPNVQRADPSQQDIDDFAGSGLAPVGDVIQVIDNYTNLSPRTVKGLDFSLYYKIRHTGIGDFTVKLSAARLLKFYQKPGPLEQQLLDAQADGTIDKTIYVRGAESLIEQDGRPKWRAAGVVTWRLGKVSVGYYGSYVGPVNDTGATLEDGTPYRVDDYLTHNLYVQYRFKSGGLLDNTQLRVGVRNIANKLPPLADTSFGYIGDLYPLTGRSFYASIRKKF
ncbi:MAG: TonB-dependent receptor domain-containing protein [Sphingomonas sp.]